MDGGAAGSLNKSWFQLPAPLLSTLFDFAGEILRARARPLAPRGAKGRADSGFARVWLSHTLKPFQVRWEMH